MSERRVFTFGFGQAFPNGYAIIEAETRGEAREGMNRAFGMRWSMDYATTEEAGVSEYSLSEVRVCAQCGGCKTRPWNLFSMDGVALFCATVFDPGFKCDPFGKI